MGEELAERFADTVSIQPRGRRDFSTWGLFIIGGRDENKYSCDDSVRRFVDGEATIHYPSMNDEWFHSVVVQCDNYIVMIGGFTPDRVADEFLVTHTFDMDEAVIVPTTVSFSPAVLGGAAGIRESAAAVSIPAALLDLETPSSASVVVVTGGYHMPPEAGIVSRRTCVLFDPACRSAVRLPDMAFRRYYHALVVFNGVLVAIGGTWHRQPYTPGYCAEQYDPAIKKWKPFPEPECYEFTSAAVVEVNGREAIYVFSCEDGMFHMFNGHEWALVVTSPRELPCFDEIFGLGSVVVMVSRSDKCIYTLDTMDNTLTRSCDEFDEYLEDAAIALFVI